MSSMLEAALRYADNGWFVFPINYMVDGRCSCGRVCKTPGKHPLTRNGFQDATTDPDQIEAWWHEHPSANIGIRTGRVSGLWVLDVDAKRSVDLGGGVLVGEGENTLAQIERRASESIPDTLTSETGGGGRHLYFTYPAEAERLGNRVRVAPSIDIRGDDGYVVAPPSVHESGKKYAWVDDAVSPAAPPDWLLTLQTETEGKPMEDPDEVGEGGRNDDLFRHGSKWRGEGRSDDEVAALIIGRNALKCKPPLGKAEVMRIISNVLKEPVNPPENEVVWEKGDDSIPELDDTDLVTISFKDMAINPPLPRTPVIGDGILDEGDGFILGGQPGVGKSWLAMDMGLSVATGKPWLDSFETEQGTVLYFDEEAGYQSSHERLQMIAAGKGIPWGSDVPFRLITPRSIRLDDPKGFTLVTRLIEQYRPSLVILDALVRFHAGNENSNQEMAALFSKVNLLRNRYHCAFVILHHVHKPTKDDPGDLLDMLRGASEIRAWPDGVFMATKNTNDTTGVGIIVHHSKSRNHAQLKPAEVGVVIDNQLKTATLAKRSALITSATSVGGRRDAIVATVQMMQSRTPVTAELIAGQTNMSLDTVQEHLKVLVGEGRLMTHKLGNKSPATYMVPMWQYQQGEMQ